MMSGMIALSADVRWSAAGWLFDWTVESLADMVASPEVAASLREIVNENLGWVGLDDFGKDAKTELLGLIRHQLLPVAERKLAAGDARSTCCAEAPARLGGQGVMTSLVRMNIIRMPVT
jgi:hypothetical protein